MTGEFTAGCLLALWACVAGSDPGDPRDAPPVKTARAVRVPNHSLQLDGRPDEALWAGIPAISDFVQKDPSFGEPPTEGMELRFAYDDDALWVGARMEVKGREVQAPLTRRDDTSRSERLWVSLDTYHDKRTAYSYGVSAAGVRMDALNRSDDERDRDDGYDPVWEARVWRGEGVWTAEFRIPFSQLRFNALDTQVFGLNVDRWIPSTNEDVYWVAVPKDETGWSSRMGELHGIEGVKPTRRIEFRPYVGATGVSGDDEGTPFRDGWDQSGRAGLDFKMGLGPNLTLESTIRPDFGQVEADPAEVNLSAFETFFPEKRPFFSEGASVFDAVEGYFYSRRIGGGPLGPVEGDSVQYPRSSEILGAAKVTGRLASGLTIGGLFALTAQEEAKLFDSATGRVTSQKVAPRTSYSVVRLKQEFGRNGSEVGLFVSGVMRDFDPASPLSAVYNRDAFSSVIDFTHRFKNRTYELSGNLGYTRVSGEPADIERLQRSSARYFQRPDATHVRLDPTRRSLDGGSGAVGLSKEEGRFLFGLFTGFESPETERNDVGSLQGADGRFVFADVAYRQTRPGRFRQWEVGVSAAGERNYAGETQSRVVGAQSSLTWRNYWQTLVLVRVRGAAQDQRLTRGGPTMGTPRGWNLLLSQGGRGFGIRQVSGRLSLSGDENGSSQHTIGVSSSLQISPSLRLSFNPTYSRSTTARQYVDTLEGGRATTFGQRYVFAAVDQTTFSMQFRAGLVLKPELTLDVYAEPFAASGRFHDYGELLAPRSRDLRRYGQDGTNLGTNVDGTRTVHDGAWSFTIGNHDFRELSFRSNVVLRWEFRPGSTFYAVWQQNRADSPAYARAGFSDLVDSISARGDNIFALKASFFWGAK